MGPVLNTVIMKLILLACLAAVAIAQNPEGSAEVLVDERVDQGDGNFGSNFETSNGIAKETRGTPGAAGQSNIAGSYRYTDTDGNPVEVLFVADEGGFQAESAAIPVAPPAPAHVAELLAIAAQQRAEGVQFNEQGFRV